MTTILARRIRRLILVALVMAGAQPVCAQPRLPTSDISRIVDVVLTRLVPPDSQLSRVSVAERTLFVDTKRTLDSFGYSSRDISDAELRLQRQVRTGSASLLGDCDRYGRQSCRQLGWGAYVWLELVSVDGQKVTVRAYVQWPERGKTAYQPGRAPTGSASLVGYSTELELAPSPEEGWKILRQGNYSVGN